MDLCAAGERYRGPHYSASDPQNGLLFWPWAAAAAANNYVSPGSSAIDFENLYRFGYNPSSLISNHANSSAAYNQQLSSMALFPTDICVQQGDHYLNSSVGPQVSPDHYQNLSQSGAGLKALSPSNVIENPVAVSLISSSMTPPLKVSPSEKSSNHENYFSRNKFLSPLSSSGIPNYHKYPSYSRPYFNYHSSQQNSSCLDSGPPPTKGYKCKMCQQLCFSKHDLARHNASAHKQDPRPYRCEHCGRQFSTGAYLGQHRRIHLGIKPYICRFCERRFTQLSHVQQHERIHTGEKPYRCLSCLKSFTQMSNLQSHQRQHMKGKPYRCEHCFMCFDIQEELDTHVQAKHAGHKYSKILVCPICGKNYNSETYLNKHIHKHKESAAAANMSVMAAAVNAVAAAAANLPRHINHSASVIDGPPAGFSKMDHLYYPSCSNPYSFYSYSSQQPPPAFMNPDFMTMGKDLSHFHSNNIFSDPFDTHFSDNRSALCMKKDDENSGTKAFGDIGNNEGEGASNEDDDVGSIKSKSNEEEENAKQALNQEINGVEAILSSINSHNLPVINFDTSSIDELAKETREDKEKERFLQGAFNAIQSSKRLNSLESTTISTVPSVGDMVAESLNRENIHLNGPDKSHLSRLQELTESSLYHQSHHHHYGNHNTFSSEAYTFMQPLVFPSFRF